MSEAIDHRKVYARGYYDALRKHGIKEMISESKEKTILRNLSAQAQRVYQSIPIEKPWSASYIQSDMQRLGSSAKDHRVIVGCINSLIEAGLVCEPEKGQYIRAGVRAKQEEKPDSTQLDKPIMATKTEIEPHQKQKKTPFTILADLAKSANEIAQMSKKLNDSLETAAIEIEEMITANDADTMKLRQLQQLLKSLN